MDYRINRHLPDFHCTFTIEFDVKFTTVTVPEDLWKYEKQPLIPNKHETKRHQL